MGEVKSKVKRRMCTIPPIRGPPLSAFVEEKGDNYTGLPSGVYVKAIRREWTGVTSKC